MIVKEYIQTTKKPYIKIGANKGDGFIYCGDPKEFIEFEQKYNAVELQRLIERVNKLERELAGFYPAYKRLMFRRYKDFKKDKANGGKNKHFKKYKTIADYIAYLKTLRIQDHKRLEKSLELAIKRRDTFTDIGTREVKEIYPSISVNKYGFKDEIVLFKGKESGSYWDLDEYENGGELGVNEA